MQGSQDKTIGTMFSQRCGSVEPTSLQEPSPEDFGRKAEFAEGRETTREEPLGVHSDRAPKLRQGASLQRSSSVTSSSGQASNAPRKGPKLVEVHGLAFHDTPSGVPNDLLAVRPILASTAIRTSKPRSTERLPCVFPVHGRGCRPGRTREAD